MAFDSKFPRAMKSIRPSAMKSAPPEIASQIPQIPVDRPSRLSRSPSLFPRRQTSLVPPPMPEPAPPKLVCAFAQTAEERERIYRFRYEVYVEEMGKKRAYIDYENKRIVDALDETARLLYVECDGRIIGTLRMNIGSETEFSEKHRKHYALDRFKEFGDAALSYTSRLMIHKDYRKSKAVQLMVASAFMLGRSLGGRFDFLCCVPALVPYYEQVGYRRYGANISDDEAGMFIPMVLLAEDIVHLEAIGSGLARLARQFPNTDETSEWFARTFPGSERVVSPRVTSLDDFWQMLVERLHRPLHNTVALFEDLSEEETKALLGSSLVLNCATGDVLIQEGDVSREMYIVLSGCFEVRAGARRCLVATFGPGEVFGEMGFVRRAKRSAQVLAYEDSTALVISPSALKKLLREQPIPAAKLLYNLTLILCGRLEASTMDLVREREEKASE